MITNPNKNPEYTCRCECAFKNNLAVAVNPKIKKLIAIKILKSKLAI